MKYTGAARLFLAVSVSHCLSAPGISAETEQLDQAKLPPPLLPGDGGWGAAAAVTVGALGCPSLSVVHLLPAAWGSLTQLSISPVFFPHPPPRWPRAQHFPWRQRWAWTALQWSPQVSLTGVHGRFPGGALGVCSSPFSPPPPPHHHHFCWGRSQIPR